MELAIRSLEIRWNRSERLQGKFSSGLEKSGVCFGLLLITEKHQLYVFLPSPGVNVKEDAERAAGLALRTVTCQPHIEIRHQEGLQQEALLILSATPSNRSDRTQL